LEKLKPLFYFDTVKLVTVHSAKLGAVHRGIQFAVILYIFIYSIWLQKGYQEYSGVNGDLYSKVKGAAYTNTSGNFTFYDNNDLIIPPLEANAMFILTSYIKTYQTRGICESTNKCKVDSDCTYGPTSNGIILANCSTTGFCMAQGWCPWEDDNDPSATVTIEGLNTSVWTIFLRSSVNYFLFDVELAEPTNPITGQDLFVLEDMLGGGDIYADCLSGCIVNVDIDWTCNLDQGKCVPVTTFTLTPGGYNYRSVQYTFDQTGRLLQKLYGVRFLIQISGQGGRFSFFRMIITIGAGAAFFTLATVITDFVLMVIFRSDQSMFSKKKYAHFGLKDSTNEEQLDYTNQS